MKKIFVVDDHAVVRRGLKVILQDELEDVVFMEAADADIALRKLAGEKPDIVILDLRLPGRSGLDILRDIKRMRQNVPVLILSMYAEEQFAERALSVGADGYLTKESAPDQLGKAVRKILAGGKYVSPRLDEVLAASPNRADGREPHKNLSSREYEVMRLISRGYTASEIAELLSLSVKTIGTYRHRLMKKMGMRTNSQITAYAVSHDLNI